MSTAVDLSALDQFNNSLARYFLFTQKEQGPLIEDRGQKVRFELWRQFKALAPNPVALKAQLEAIAANRGLRRRFGANALVVSTAEEIKLRLKSVKFLSVSFLLKAWRNRAGGQNSRFLARTRSGVQIGSANVATTLGTANPYVSLTSLLEGAVKQDDEKQIAARALIAQAADMETYLARKHEEKLAQLFSSTANRVVNIGR
jgi:hypothetical protein